MSFYESYFLRSSSQDEKEGFEQLLQLDVVLT